MRKVVPEKSELPVVVGVDGSRAALDIVDLAAAEAVRRGARLVIVHVWPGRYGGPFRSRGAAAPGAGDGRHLVDLAARRAQHREPGLHVSTELVDDSPADTLVRRSAGAALIVVGHHDAAGTRRSWGSTAAYLAHHSACPILLYRGAVPAPGPVVVAVSGHRTATLACACEEAALCGSRLVAVHVWTVGDAAGAARQAAQQAAERSLAAALARWLRAYPQVEVDRLLLHELDVAYALERASGRGRILVAGTGRNGRFAEALYGLHGAALTRQPPCPVLLVPPFWSAAGVIAAGPRT
jgi:nucleotide-binding universal stress UspA family protein